MVTPYLLRHNLQMPWRADYYSVVPVAFERSQLRPRQATSVQRT